MSISSEKKKSLLNKDWCLTYEVEDVDKVQVMLSENEQEYILMLSSPFLPKKSERSLDVKRDYVFLIDRSGSMQGERMQLAKTSLITALKSLPVDSSFNIYSFGSSHESVFPGFVEANDENLESAISEIQKFNANLGGTELIHPLIEILSKARDVSTAVMVITDGQVEDVEEIAQMIIEKNKKNVSIYSIGIGAGASRYLLETLPKVSSGSWTLILNEKLLGEKMVEFMLQSLEPFETDHHLLLPSNIQPYVNKVLPKDENHPTLRYSDFALFFVHLNKSILGKIDSFAVKVSRSTSTNVYMQQAFEVSLAQWKVKGNTFSAFGAFLEISFLQTRLLYCYLKTVSDDVIQLSIENQILSNETTYICTSKKIALNSETEEDRSADTIRPKKFHNECAVSRGNIQLECAFVSNPGPTRGGGIINESYNPNEDFEMVNDKSSPSKNKEQDIERKDFDTIVSKFKHKGYWDDGKLTKSLSCSNSFLEEQKIISKFCNERKLSNEILLTITMLFFLDKVYKKFEKESILIRKKAIIWLQSNKVDYERDLEL
jgi:hypothetical protein